MGRNLHIRRTRTNSVVFDMIENNKRTSFTIDEVTWCFLVASFDGIEGDAYYWVKDLTKQHHATKDTVRFEVMRTLSPQHYKKAYEVLHQKRLAL